MLVSLQILYRQIFDSNDVRVRIPYFIEEMYNQKRLHAAYLASSKAAYSLSGRCSTSCTGDDISGVTITGFDYWHPSQRCVMVWIDNGTLQNQSRRLFADNLMTGTDNYFLLTIKDLGRWESLEMVQRLYEVTYFSEQPKFYKALHG